MNLWQVAEDEARRLGLDPSLVARVMRQESGGNPRAVSPKGARGPMQLMPGTARDLGVNIDDPVANTRGGVRYLKQQMDAFGTPELALAAYNAGPGAVRKHGGVPPFAETRAYVRKINGNGGSSMLPSAADLLSDTPQPQGRRAAAPAPGPSSPPGAAMPSAADLLGGGAQPGAKPKPSLLGDAVTGFLEPWNRLRTDVTNEYKRVTATAKAGPPKSLRDAATGALADLAGGPRILGDALGLLASPVTALTRPASSAINSLPVRPYTQDTPFSAPRAMEGEEARAAIEGSLNLALSGVRPAGGSILRTSPIPARPASRPAPKPEAKGTAYVERVAKSAKATPDTLMAATADKPITAAEAIGRPGEVALGALARREGLTGDALGGALADRHLTRGPRMLDDFADAAGVSPQAASGDIQAFVEDGRALAAPLYEDAYAAGPIYNADLEKLIVRPSMKKAMANAYRIAREEGTDPEALGLVNVEDPAAWDSIAPPHPDGATAPKVPRGPAKAPSRGKSLVKYLADRGGIKDDGGELAAMDAKFWNRGKAFQRRLIGTESPDDMALRAWEEGYFPEFAERPSINDLYTAIDAELRGKPRYAREADQAASDRFRGREAGEELAYRGGDAADLPTPDQYVGRPEPTSEPAYQFQPTAKAWDYIKRGLDDVLDGYRDKTTGKLQLDTEGRSILSTVKELRQRLIEANPAYGEALKTAGDYLGAESAFKDGGKFILNNQLTERQFADRLAKMSTSEREAFKGGIANKLFDLAQSGKLDPRVLATPRVRTKLTMALGRDAAALIIEKARLESRMQGFERRYGPGANSVTMELQQAAAEQDGGGALGEMAGDFVSGLHRGPKSAAAGMLGRQFEKFAATLRTKGLGVEGRDEAGRLLMMSPQELAELLRARRAAPKPRGRLPSPRDLVGVGVVSQPLRRLPSPKAPGTSR